MSLASIRVVVVTLLMLGLFMLVSLNINFITTSVKDQVEIVVYVADDATAAEREELHALLSKMKPSTRSASFRVQRHCSA